LPSIDQLLVDKVSTQYKKKDLIKKIQIPNVGKKDKQKVTQKTLFNDQAMQ